MADSTTLPGQRAALVDRNGVASPEFYRFFRGLSATAGLPASVNDLTARVTALEGVHGNVGNVVGKQSITSYGVLSSGVVTINLSGDVDTVPAMSSYGALADGVRGWHTYSANFATLTNGDGTHSLDLSDLADSGTGTALVKITRDAKGRVSGTSAATTTDLAEGANLYFTDTRADARITLQKAQPLGLATLDAAGKLDAGQLPALAITETFVVNTEAAMLALSAQEGDVAVRTDLSKSFILTAAPASTLANWQELLVPTGGVTSFNGRTGSVTPASGDYTKAQVGLGNVDNTSDADKPVSTAQAVALALKQDASALGTAAFANTGNNAAGLVPVLDSPGAGQTSLTLVGPSARANLYLQSGNADASNIGEGTLSFAATGSVSSSTEKRLGIFAVNTDGVTAGHRGGRFVVNLKQNGNTTILTRLSVGYLGHTEPGVDNAQTMGSSSLRWSVVYAGTGSINTSDARDKNDVAPLTADELAAAADLSRAVGTYQWLESVQLKGADARHHAGLTVQQAIAIMQAHSLDPFRYGFICYDQWDELPEVVNSWPAQDAVLDDAGNVITPAIEAGSEVTQAYRPAGDRYSFRHDELLLFIARGFAARLDALESA